MSASFSDNSVEPPAEDGLSDFGAWNFYAQGSRSTLSADLFASVSCSAQYGNFQRLFFDLTRLNARLDFPSGSRFIAGASSLVDNFYKSQQPSLEAVRAVCPNVMLSLQQQVSIYSPFLPFEAYLRCRVLCYNFLLELVSQLS